MSTNAISVVHVGDFGEYGELYYAYIIFLSISYRLWLCAKDSIAQQNCEFRHCWVEIYYIIGLPSSLHPPVAVNCMRFDDYRLCEQITEHVNCESAATVSQTHCHGLTGLCCATLHCISTRDVPIV